MKNCYFISKFGIFGLARKLLMLPFILLTVLGHAQSDLIITGVIDGPRSGGLPKAIELYVLNNIASLNEYQLILSTNGSTGNTATFTFPAGAASAGSFIYVSQEIPEFQAYFGVAPNYPTSGNVSVANFNGNDVVRLFKNGTPVDIYGVLGVEGTSQPWEYLDSWAYRKNGTGPSASFDINDWNVLAPNSLDALGLSGTNPASGSLRFPLGTYQAGTLDLSTYVRIGRYNLPVPSRQSAPAGSQLALEVSAVTYNPNTNTLFVLDDEGTSIVQVSKNGQLIDVMTLTAGDFVDPEGLTHVSGNEFVLIEERERQANLFTYAPGGTLSRTDVESVKLGTTVGNIGLEGISLDPQTGGYVLVKETNPQGIFQTAIDFGAGTATNGSPSTVNSTNLFDPALAGLTDLSDVYALSNLPAPLTDDNLLVLSQEDGKLINIDRSGTITNALTITTDAGNPLTVAEQGNEGVTMDNNGLLYIVNFQGGGDGNHPQLWVYAPASYIYANAAPVEVSIANPVTSLAENTSTTTAIQVGIIIIISDDALGTNTLSLTGADAAAFEIVGTGLFLKAGTVLDFETKTSYQVTVNVDDASLGNTPDAITNFTLNITDITEAVAAIIISEVAPWSSGNSPGVLAAWFEVTNTSSTAVDITGWRVDDSSNSFTSAVALNGVTSIPPGQSVIFIEGDATKITAFVNTWFGGTLPSGVQIGTYSGSGVGLGTGGDAVNLFDAGGTLVTGVTFGVSPSASPFATFDNAAGDALVSTLSIVGVNGAYSIIDVGANAAAVLIGSPGTISVPPVPLTTQVAIAATDAAAAEQSQNPGKFTVLRTGDTTNPLTVVYGFAVGAGQATSDDYTPTLIGNVEIPAGANSVDITITPVDDPTPEGTETITLVLADQPDYDVAANASSATVTIADNDLAPGQAFPLSENFSSCPLTGWQIISVDVDVPNTWTCNSSLS